MGVDDIVVGLGALSSRREALKTAMLRGSNKGSRFRMLMLTLLPERRFCGLIWVNRQRPRRHRLPV